ncbi:bacillithiol system redox-active protein YtxJ [Roseisolibacter sp. H3M3-2]|uniref:bacillithiol system redox-active protein YtxJ n=1 Tax=Roseisolibacter sp. H3M3-2 TaxID=3031323 RepID=UPI0023D9EE02|nr:bacillithiol system redox-active protein YtxJ [Roseisolibacter sp. H3M3-2]MDF1504411.1 bacillithiol system redox-active protein YtxJ [Roseisolibacter sp. H3M3-2]
MRDLTTEAEADAPFREATCVLLKHGAHCPISRAARAELEAFAERHPDVPVYRVEVTEHRALSDALAARLGVEHQSPQAFVLRDGAPAWHAAHFDITADGLERRVRE